MADARYQGKIAGARFAQGRKPLRDNRIGAAACFFNAIDIMATAKLPLLHISNNEICNLLIREGCSGGAAARGFKLSSSQP
jgi:hypothetical protein